MKKPNVIIEILKLFAIMVVGWMMWLLVFAITITPDEAEMAVEPFPGAALIFGLLTGLAIALGIKYNTIHRVYQNTKAMKSNIGVVEERSDRLLDKANRVAVKYMDFEQTVQLGIARVRGTGGKSQNRIYNANQFQSALENYPDLKANESVMELLYQIKDCEKALANQKMSYNGAVENYNTIIHSFPATIIRVLFRMKDAEYYEEQGEVGLVSDEALGI